MILPIEVQTDEQTVRISWSDGHESTYTNMRLREACPCAVCKGEQGLLGRMYVIPVIANIPDNVRANAHRMIGRYAIAFDWSDGHHTGIYPYDYLLQLCECEKCSQTRSA